MSEFYDEMRAVASEVFAEFQQGTIRHIAMQRPAGATPDDPGAPVPVFTTINATARPVSRQYVDGTLITGVETEVGMPNDGVTPKVEDFMEIDTVRHKIVKVMPRPAAGVPVSFTVIVKR